jgi:superoxide reductase
MIELGAGKIQVVTGHVMKGHEHYITKHTLLDRNFKFLSEFMFDPMKHKSPKSEFAVNNYTGKVYVLSHCNKHDTWMNSVEL